MIQVKVPTPLRKLTQGAGSVEAQGGTVAALIDDLERRYPGMKERLCDEAGQVRRFVNIFVNGEDIRFLSHLDTALKAGDELSIVPAIAGGR
jgi:molybdopterin synthase sulfur carrier subunit